jgi:hypothetical protein
MFRALASIQKEGFVAQNQYLSQTMPKFDSRLPNMVVTGIPTAGTTKPQQVLQNANLGLGTWDPNTRQTSTRDIDIANYATSIDVATSLNTQNNTCKVTSLDSLMNTQNPNDRVRCGWIYKKGSTPGAPPAVSQGALGTMTGPVATFPSPQGTWYWSLDDAKKAMEIDKCAALTDCKQVGTPKFKGCAYSKTRGMGIPVDEQGNVKYYRDPKASAPPSSLVRSPGGCPAPPAVGSAAYEYQRSRDVCTPLPNGQLSRDCMLQQITVAGCKPDGSLYIALQTGASPTNYAATLQTMTPFKKYQEAAKKPLMDNVIRDGRTTTEIALGNFKDLAQQTVRREETALSYAARDLCLKKGTMDKFDFCTELKDTTRGPFLLECLQNEFRRQGGQPAGTSYPSTQNLATWSGMGTWGQVKAQMTALVAKTKSKDEVVQRQAMTQLLGIVRQPYGFKQIGIIQGMEVIWSNDSTNTVLGRKLTIGAKAAFPRFSTGGVVEETGLPDRVSYIALNNVRPPQDMSVRLRLETADGIIYTLNKDVDTVGTRGKSIQTSDTLGANWDQPTTRYDAKQCWNLKGQGPNYILGAWQDTTGQAHSAVMYSPCNGTQFKDIPATWLTLTQEPDAPMFSWEGVTPRNGSKQFMERRLPVAMAMNASPQTSVVASTVIPKIGALLKLKNNGSGYAITNKNFAMNSWRTLTTQFVLHSLADGAILRFGPIEFGIQNRMAICSYSSGSLKVKKAWPIQTTNAAYYFYVNMRSEFEGKYPNRLTMAFGLASDFRTGRINVQQEGQSVASFTTTQNAPLYAQSDAAKVELGDKTARLTADVSVGYLRLFDYEMNSNDVQRDIQNAWLMEFFRN